MAAKGGSPQYYQIQFRVEGPHQLSLARLRRRSKNIPHTGHLDPITTVVIGDFHTASEIFENSMDTNP